MNIYIPIDPSWSYRFFNIHKKIIAGYDFFTFHDRFMTTAVSFLMAHVNFRFNQDNVSYHTGCSMVSRLIDDYPQLGVHLPKIMYALYHTHVDALMAIPGPIVNYQLVIDDDQVLTGIVFVICNRSI